MNALEETRIKLLAVDCLLSMKQQRTFRDLAKELSLPAGVLNRYINGYVLPKHRRAAQIITYFSDKYLPKHLDASKIKQSKYIETTTLLSQPFLLNVIAYNAARQFKDKISVVLTAAVDGIPLAQAIANLLGVRFAYAKLTQEFSPAGHFASKTSPDRPISTPFYLPKALLKKNESILIVDDVIRAGATFEALTSICNQARATIVGIFALFITSQAYTYLKRNHKVRYLLLAD